MCAKLGVKASPAEAAALFKRAGYGESMPYQKWAHNLVTQQNRQLAQDSAGEPQPDRVCIVCKQHNPLHAALLVHDHRLTVTVLTASCGISLVAA